MTNQEIEENLKSLSSEIEVLRARGDVLAIALRQAVLSNPNPRGVHAAIMENLDATAMAASGISSPSEIYSMGYEIARLWIGKWLDGLPRARA